jgi:hypothetical protein
MAQHVWDRLFAFEEIDDVVGGDTAALQPSIKMV